MKRSVANGFGMKHFLNDIQSLHNTFSAFRKRTILSSQWVSCVPLAQWIARWTSNPKVLGSTPRWDDDFFLFSWLLCDMALPEVQARISSFLSVAVITCASHAQGRRFEPGRKHSYFASSARLAFVVDVDDTR